MELRHLRYFVAVAEQGTVTGAAARLGIQQPPLSQQIKALEAELSVKLFDRGPRGVELTVAGAAFLEDSRAILASADRAADKARRVAAGARGTVTVGFTRSITLHELAPRIIREFRRIHPEVSLEFREGNAAELTESVARDDVDVAFVHVPVARPPGLIFHRLLEEDVLVVLPMEHAIARRGVKKRVRAVSLTALANEPFILVRRPGAPGLYANLIAACIRRGFTPVIAAEVNSMLANIMLVASGVGVSVVPASMSGAHTDNVFYGTLHDVPELSAPITLVYKEGGANPAAQGFIAFSQSLIRP